MVLHSGPLHLSRPSSSESREDAGDRTASKKGRSAEERWMDHKKDPKSASARTPPTSPSRRMYDTRFVSSYSQASGNVHRGSHTSVRDIGLEQRTEGHGDQGHEGGYVQGVAGSGNRNEARPPDVDGTRIVGGWRGQTRLNERFHTRDGSGQRTREADNWYEYINAEDGGRRKSIAEQGRRSSKAEETRDRRHSNVGDSRSSTDRKRVHFDLS